MSRVALVDGSNVALHPLRRASRLSQLKGDLVDHGFPEVRVICDASLRWAIKEEEQREILEAGIKSGDFQQVPAKTQADDFILSSTLDWREEGWEVFVITNDLFKEFQEDDKFRWLWEDDRFVRFFINQLPNGKERVHLKLKGEVARLESIPDDTELGRPVEIAAVTEYDGRYTCNKKGKVWMPVSYGSKRRYLESPTLEEVVAFMLTRKPRGGRFDVSGGEVWYWPEIDENIWSHAHLGTIKTRPNGDHVFEPGNEA